ncbi:hypothetical protein ABPG74_010160 [Tetrahymena malaccensis]
MTATSAIVIQWIRGIIVSKFWDISQMLNVYNTFQTLFKVVQPLFMKTFQVSFLFAFSNTYLLDILVLEKGHWFNMIPSELVKFHQSKFFNPYKINPSVFKMIKEKNSKFLKILVAYPHYTPTRIQTILCPLFVQPPQDLKD